MYIRDPDCVHVGNPRSGSSPQPSSMGNLIGDELLSVEKSVRKESWAWGRSPYGNGPRDSDLAVRDVSTAVPTPLRSCGFPSSSAAFLLTLIMADSGFCRTPTSLHPSICSSFSSAAAHSWLLCPSQCTTTRGECVLPWERAREQRDASGHTSRHRC